MDSSQPCDVCGIRSTKTCGKCKAAFYCSVDHQKLFWKYHKLNCGLENNNFSFYPMPELQESEAPNALTLLMGKSGQYIIITRNIDWLKKARLLQKNNDPKQILLHLQSTIFGDANDSAKKARLLSTLRHEMAPTNYPTELNHPFSPYYRIARFQDSFNTSQYVVTSKFSFPFFHQLFNYSCLMSLLGKMYAEDSSQITPIMDYLNASVGRLSILMKEVKKKNVLSSEKNIYEWMFGRCAKELETLQKMLRGERTVTEGQDLLRKYDEAAYACFAKK